MNLTEYAPKAMAFASIQATPKDDLIHAALGMTSDTGELLECVAEPLVFGNEVDVVNLTEELGDVIWFTNLAASVLNLDLQTAYVKAIEGNDLVGSTTQTSMMWPAIETARFADRVKGHAIYGKPLDLAAAEDELGNIVLSLTALAGIWEISLERILEANIAKLTARYGAKFDHYRAVNRDKDAEREAIGKVE